MPYHLYQVTGPTGKVYVGISKNVHARWITHRRKARVENKRHPFYDAIRKYGHEAFTVLTICGYDDIEVAKAVEVAYISLSRATERAHGYNVSRGGDYDSSDGHAIALAGFRANPEKYDAYRKALSVALKKAAAEGRIDPSALLAYNAARPKRDVWKQLHRAHRVAAKLPARKNPNAFGGRRNGNAAAVKAAWEAALPSAKKRHAIKSRENAKATWASRTLEEKNALFSRIGQSLRTRYETDPEYRAVADAKLAKGRKNMDRAKQGSAASAGLKRFWEELRKDPARYAEYMARRTASLMRTICSK